MSTPGIADDPSPLSTGDTSENLQTPATDSQRPTENPPAENEQPVEKILDTQTDQAADQCESPSIPKETTPVEAKASPEVTNPVKASVAKKILNPSATAFKPKLEAPVKAPKNKAQVNLSKENNENKKASPNKKEDQSKAVNQQSNVARKSSTTAMNKAIPHHQLLHHNVGRLGVIPPTSNHQMYVPLHHHHHHHGLMMMPGDPSMINMILMGQPPGTLASPPLMPNHLMQQYLQHPAGPANPMMLVPTPIICITTTICISIIC